MKRTMVWVWMAMVALPSVAFGQNAAFDAQQKLLAVRAAKADCYRQLAETVYGVQITSDTYVRDFVTESDEIRTSVDAFVRGVKLGQPTFYEDGSAEVPASVKVAKIVTMLKEVHTAHYKGNKVTTTDIEQIKQRVHTEEFHVIGSGAPRPELPPDLPEGVEDMIDPLPSGFAPKVKTIPAIWKTVSPQARLMAQRAARVDAMRQLLERIMGVRITSDTLVRDFVTESDEISARAQGIVIGASEVGTYLHEDELIVEVTMAVPVEKVITTIKELHSTHYQGRKVTTTDITNIKKAVKRDVFEATGAGVPPARFVQQAIQSGYEMPTWFAEPITVYGECTDDAIDTPQGKLMAARCARLDAYRNLGEQVYGLQIDSSTYVRDFVTESDEIQTRMQAVIRGATFDQPEYSGGTARVKAYLPAAEIWAVVNDFRQVRSR
jgi:hypothetical protein